VDDAGDLVGTAGSGAAVWPGLDELYFLGGGGVGEGDRGKAARREIDVSSQMQPDTAQSSSWVEENLRRTKVDTNAEAALAVGHCGRASEEQVLRMLIVLCRDFRNGEESGGWELMSWPLWCGGGMRCNVPLWSGGP